MIRVCHVITDLDVGGAENTLAALVAAVDPTRFEQHVVTLIEPGPVGRRIAAAGVPVTNLGLKRGQPRLEAIRRLVALLRGTRPTILQTWLYHADLLGTVASGLARTPRIIWNLRCSDMGADQDSRYLPLVVRTLAALSSFPDAVVINSRAGREAHLARGYRPKNWVEIPNGVDSQRFRPCADRRSRFRQSLAIPDAAPVIGLVARVHAMKDHSTFMAAAAMFARDRPDAVFVLAGDGTGPESQALTPLIEKFGLAKHVRLLGMRSDLENVYPALDISTLCSAYGEGFPNVLLEAMSCGVPCVATDVGDSRWIVGATGHLVPIQEPAALAAAWGKLLASDHRALSAAARARSVNEFSFDRMRAKYEALYFDLAGPVRGKTPS
jgi:glycosyltransferase involved in cell wall biosynthesis